MWLLQMMAERNLQRLEVLFEDAKNDNLDRHYRAAMRWESKIYVKVDNRKVRLVYCRSV